MQDFGFPTAGTWAFRVNKRCGETLVEWVVDFESKTVSSVTCHVNKHLYKILDVFDPLSFADFCWFMDRRVWRENYDGLEDEYTRYNCTPRNRFTLLLKLGGRVASDDFELDWEVLND